MIILLIEQHKATELMDKLVKQRTHGVLQNKMPGCLKVYNQRYDAPVVRCLPFLIAFACLALHAFWALAFSRLKKILKITPVANAPEQAMGS